MRIVRPLFLSWVQKVIRDEEVAVIFLKEFWPRIVGDRLAQSTVALWKHPNRIQRYPKTSLNI